MILRREGYGDQAIGHLIHLAVCHTFEELDGLMERFQIASGVIDGLPETHATREFVRRPPRCVYMNFFNEHQRGSPRWDEETCVVQVNRTEALDASRAAVRDHKLVLPRRSARIDEFAQHLAADAKILDEDAVINDNYCSRAATTKFPARCHPPDASSSSEIPTPPGEIPFP